MKVLVIELAYLGDTLMATPFLRALKEYQPFAEIHFLASLSSVEALKGNPNLTRIIAFEKRGGVSGLLTTAIQLRRERFDLAFVLHRSFRSALLAALAGIPVRVGYGVEGRSMLLTRALPYNPSIHRTKNHLLLFEYYRSTTPLREAGVLGSTWQHAAEPDNPTPQPDRLEFVALDEAVAVAREKFLQDVGDYFVINPAGSWPTKQWLPERFAELAARISSERQWVPVIIGDGGDKGIPMPLIERAVDLRGQTTLPELAAIFKGAKVFISNDSGPLHIGVAMGVPTVSIFGPTDARRTGPYAPGAVIAAPGSPPSGAPSHVALQAQVWCSPCYLKKCPAARGFVCMKSIRVEQVLDAVRRVAPPA